MTQLLTVDQVAQRAAVSPKTITRWARAGLIEYVRLGKYMIRFSEEAVERFLADRTKKIQEVKT